MNHSVKIFALLAFIAIFPSCKQEDNNACIAGQGGELTIAAYPKNNFKKVMAYSAWVKYNTKTQPGTNSSDYDLVVPAVAGQDHVLIKNLKCGDYYVYMTGYDSSIGRPVNGGIGYTLMEYPEPTTVGLDVPVLP